MTTDVDLRVAARAAARARAWLERRDAAICAAVDAGASLREVGAAVGLSHVAVRKIALRPRTR